MDVPELRTETASALEHGQTNDSQTDSARDAAKKEARKKYNDSNRELIRFQQRTLLAEKRKDPAFKARERENQRLWRERNREHLRAEYKKTYRKNPQARMQSVRRSEAKNKEHYRSLQKRWRGENKEKVKSDMAKWTAENKDYLAQKAKEYLPRRKELSKIRRLDPVERIKDACRTRTLFILRKAGIPKFNHTFDLIGCTPDFFKEYLTARFLPGMTWDNFGEWEIDHIHPLARIDLRDEAKKRAAFHYSNCQPLWKPDNRRKCDTLPAAHQPFLI